MLNEVEKEEYGYWCGNPIATALIIYSDWRYLIEGEGRKKTKKHAQIIC